MPYNYFHLLFCRTSKLHTGIRHETASVSWCQKQNSHTLHKKCVVIFQCWVWHLLSGSQRNKIHYLLFFFYCANRTKDYPKIRMIAWNEDVFGECDWKILPSCRREIECLRVFIPFPTGISRRTIICHDPNPTYYNERKKQNHANYPLIRAIYVIKTTYAHESAIKSNYISLFTERKWIAFDDAACIKKRSTRRDLSDDSSTKSIVWNG